MPEFLRKIIDAKKFDMLLADFATIPWRLSAASESMTVSKTSLTPEQKALIGYLEEQELIKTYSYLPDYAFYPPDNANPEQSSLWNAAFPAARERLYEYLKPFLNLPWKPTNTNSDDYYVWTSELDAEQRALIESVTDDSIKDERSGSLTIGLRSDDTLYVLGAMGRGYIQNRLHEIVAKQVQDATQRDGAIIAQLPWQFDREGNMTVDAAIVPTLAAEFDLTVPGPQKLLPSGETVTSAEKLQLKSGRAEVEDILTRRKIKTRDGKYVLIVSTTTSKLWDALDGENDITLLHFYDLAHDVAVDRQKPVLSLPWHFDKGRWAFVVTDEDLAASQHKDNIENALVKQGGVYEVHSLKDFTWRASGPQAQVAQFRDQLEAVVPDDIDIADLADLQWKYEGGDLTIPHTLFMQSKFAKSMKVKTRREEVRIKLPDSGEIIPFNLDYHGKVKIHRDNVKELPYFAAVKRTLEQRYEQFVNTHADAIRALLWSFELSDKIETYNAVLLYSEDLSKEQRQLVDMLSGMNQLGEESSKQFRVHSDRLHNLLLPQFEQWKPLAIAAIAEFPWEHQPSGIQLILKPEAITSIEAEGLERVGLHCGQYGYFHTSSAREGRSQYTRGDEVFNLLRKAIAEKIRERIPVSAITEDIAALPWQYGGRLQDRSIVLDCGRISEEQVTLLKAAIPEIYHQARTSLFNDDPFLDKSRKGYFELAAEGDYYLTRSILDRPYYAALKPVAERNLTHLVKEVATYPWRKNDQNEYTITERDLTKEQQLKIKQIPSDCFNREAEIAQRDIYSHNRLYVLDTNAKDNQLIKALNSKATALPGPR